MKPTNSDSDYTTKQSKLDKSGTDPNRYGGYYSEDQAKELGNIDTASPSLIPGFEVNVSTVERVLMVALGAFLLVRAIKGSKSHIVQTFAGTTLLARGISGYCPVYDVTDNVGGSMKSCNVNIKSKISINRPVSEVYDFWRNLENLPKFMNHLDTVEETSNLRSHWTAKGPVGIGRISWDAEILNEEKDRMLSWHSLPDSTVDNSGKVNFSSNGTGTDLDITISYCAPFGVAGETAAKWLNPYFEKMVQSDIEGLKDYLETGREAKR